MSSDWRPIPSAPGFYVSAAGEIAREVDGEYRVHEAAEGRSGWMEVQVLSMKRRPKRVQVHRVVAEVWLRWKGAVGHKNGNWRDNRKENLLKMASEREAKEQSGRLRYRRGERQPQAKLVAEQVVAIRRRAKSGSWTQEELAEQFGVSRQLISKIVRKQVWKEVG